MTTSIGPAPAGVTQTMVGVLHERRAEDVGAAEGDRGGLAKTCTGSLTIFDPPEAPFRTGFFRRSQARPKLRYVAGELVVPTERWQTIPEPPSPTPQYVAIDMLQFAGSRGCWNSQAKSGVGARATTTP